MLDGADSGESVGAAGVGGVALTDRCAELRFMGASLPRGLKGVIGAKGNKGTKRPRDQGTTGPENYGGEGRVGETAREENGHLAAMSVARPYRPTGVVGTSFRGGVTILRPFARRSFFQDFDLLASILFATVISGKHKKRMI